MCIDDNDIFDANKSYGCGIYYYKTIENTFYKELESYIKKNGGIYKQYTSQEFYRIGYFNEIILFCISPKMCQCIL